MGVYLVIAARNLIQARRRSLLMSSALMMVTTLLVMLMALSQGLTDTMIRAATTLSSGHVNISGFFKAKSSDAAPIVSGAPEIRKIVKENTPGLDYVIDRHRGWARVISETGSLQAGLTGIDISEEQRFMSTIQLAEEQEYKTGGKAQVVGDLKRLSEPNSALIFVNQAKKLNVGVGDTLTITIEINSGARNTGDVTVVAVAKDVGFMSNWNVFLPKQKLIELYRLQPTTTGAVMVYLKDVEDSDRMLGHLRKVFSDKGYTLMEHDPRPFFMKFETVAGEDWTGQRLDLTMWRDEVSYLTWVLTALSSVSGLLIGILLIIIVIGIMNSMWMSVRERTGEVGTLRAIGMSRGRILMMFMLEALLLGLFATTLGSILGASIAAGLDAAQIKVPVDALKAILLSDQLHLSVRAPQLIESVLAFTAITGLSALWPALRASRMQPVTAIQHVN